MAAGGAERVFWLLSQGFNKDDYEVSIVILNIQNAFFPLELDNVRIVDLNTKRTSLSFPKLYKLIKKERPYAVFGTGDEINFLISSVSLFVKIPFIIARPTSISTEMLQFSSIKGKVLNRFTSIFYKNFNVIVCQSLEIKNALLKTFKVNPDKMVVIPNPVLISDFLKAELSMKRLIIVGRLTGVKGHDRLLQMFSELPDEYTLTCAGDGELKETLISNAGTLNVLQRVNFLGRVSNPIEIISQHDVLVLTSYSEGFPNVILESLSVGVPVVTFRVGGVSNFVVDDYNGYIVEQDDLEGFKKSIIKACARKWNSEDIKNNIRARFSLEKISSMYEDLIEA